MLSSDINLMRKYIHGRDVDESDLPHIRNLCSIGLMNTGISIKRRKITASVTQLGSQTINIHGKDIPYIEPKHPVILFHDPVTRFQKEEVKPDEKPKPAHVGRFDDIID